MSHIYYSEQIAKRTFCGINTKDAYMQAVKWYATNIIAKDDLHNIQVEYVKEKDNRSVTIKLFAVLDETEVKEQHCECCKEMHRSFFINEATECSKCSIAGYQRRLERKLQVKSGYYKELLSKVLKEEDV